jgi:hypothetical protein
MGNSDVKMDAEGKIEITVEGRIFTTEGPIVGVAWRRDPIEARGPSGYIEPMPGPYEDVTLTFKAFEMHRGERIVGQPPDPLKVVLAPLFDTDGQVDCSPSQARRGLQRIWDLVKEGDDG